MKRGVLICVLIGILLVNVFISFVLADNIDNVLNKGIKTSVEIMQDKEEQRFQEDQIYALVKNQQEAMGLENNTLTVGIYTDNLKIAEDLSNSTKNNSLNIIKSEVIQKKNATLAKNYVPKGVKKISAKDFDKKVGAVKQKKEIQKKNDVKKKEVAKNKTIALKKKTAVKATVKKATAKVIQSVTDLSFGVFGLSGYAVKELSYYNLELPNSPETPGEVNDVTNPRLSEGKFSILGLITGNAIIGTPDWSFDGSKKGKGNFIWKGNMTSSAGLEQHFELSLQINMSKKNSQGKTPVNGIVYSKGYYLNDYLQKWVEFDYEGTKVGSTGWLREAGSKSLTLTNVTSKDYVIFLAYSCAKWYEESWECNDGKWVIFAVETGNVSYNKEIGDVPDMEYSEVKDLDITNIPSILKQFNVSAFDFQPVLVDGGIIAPNNNFEAPLESAQKIDFYVVNFGNRNLTNLSYEIDVGESSIAEVVSAQLPSNVGINKSERGSITLYLKERGNFKFNLYLKPDSMEVDTSDNMEIFNFTIGEPITTRQRTDPLNQSWNRTINYTIKEGYTYKAFDNSSQLYIISGTNKMRTVWGGYWHGTSINPTIRVTSKPILTEEALFSTPWVAAIFVGGEMLTGDRETVEYYVEITNTQTNKSYTTPLLESMYKYYFAPKALIPDFEFCVNYTQKVILKGGTNEQIDIMDPKPFNLCNSSKFLNMFVARRLLKLDGNYVVVSGGLDEKYFEEGQNISYFVTFTDPRNPSVTYNTTILGTADKPGFFRTEDLFKNRYIDYSNGEWISGKATLLNIPNARGNTSVKFGTKNEKLHFVWRGWNVNVNLGMILKMKDELIQNHKSLYAYSFSRYSYIDGKSWKSYMSYSINLQKPSYMDMEYFKDILSKTSRRFSIRDVNTNKIVYERSWDCGLIKSQFKPQIYDKYYYDYHQFCISSYYQSSDLINYSEFEGFKDGHYYDFNYVISGEKINFFAPISSMRILYIDGFQLIANNPLLRTRFYNLQNHPTYIGISGAEVRKGVDYVPGFSIRYSPKNNRINLDTQSAEEVDVSKREIPLSDLGTFEDGFYLTDSLDFIIKNNTKMPIFNSIFMTITPIKDAASIDFTRKQFNCKLGRYDMVCYRSNSGYNVNYIDTINNFMYSISLIDESNRFIKKYRDNPKKYDAVLYDILTEIDGNPIMSLETSEYFENDFYIDGYYSGKQLDFPFTYMGIYNETTCNLQYSRNYQYVLLDEGFKSKDAGSLVQTVFLNQGKDYTNFQFSFYLRDGNEIRFIGNFSKYWDIYGLLPCYFARLNLTDGKAYSIIVKSLNSKFVSIERDFVYKDNYYDTIINKYSKYLKKIPELNTTLAAADISNKYLFKDGRVYQLENNYIYLPRTTLQPRFGFLDRISQKSGKVTYFTSYNSFNAPKFKNYNGQEDISKEELKEYILGNSSTLMDSKRYYYFYVYLYEDIYEFYKTAPTNYNTFNTSIGGISCYVTRDGYSNRNLQNASRVTLHCTWANLDELEIYTVAMHQIFENKSENDLYNLDSGTLYDMKDNYFEPVLRKYTTWFKPTPFNTTYDAYN